MPPEQLIIPNTGRTPGKTRTSDAFWQTLADAYRMNSAKLRQMASRVAQMEGAERRDRLRQELAKRQDGVLAKLGYDFARRIRRSGRPRGGNFFFGPEDLWSRLDLLRQRLPEQVSGIIGRAEKILQHRFELLGFSDLDFGSPID